MKDKLSWVEFNPTMICNAKVGKEQPLIKGAEPGCSYCYAAGGIPTTKEEVLAFQKRQLSTKEIIGFIDEMANQDVKRLYILGGEPQIRTDFKEIMEYAVKKIPLVKLSTNGTGSENNLETLLKIPVLEVSLDSHIYDVAVQTRPSTIVKTALKTIDLLVDHPFFGVNAVVTPFNLNSMDEFIDWSFKKGAKTVNLYPLLNANPSILRIAPGTYREMMQKLNQKYLTHFENYCKSGKHVIVNDNGEIIPCAAFIGTENVIGTVNDYGSALSNDLFQKIASYDFENYHIPHSFISSNCPAKSLFDSNWQEPKVPLRKMRENKAKKYCLRCNQELKSEQCAYCGFEITVSEPIIMACNCFTIYNPIFYPIDSGKLIELGERI